ncbi:MAG: hypothetical protein ABSC06_34410, partial [Rhodopila sp.]
LGSSAAALASRRAIAQESKRMPPPKKTGLTYMIGYGGGANPSGVATIEAWLGRPLDLMTDGTTTGGFARTGFVSANGRPSARVIGIPMLSVEKEAEHLTDMAQAANGGYNGRYAAMLTNMRNNTAAPIVAIRPGWEGPGGNWYPWSAGSYHGFSNESYATYIGAFRNIAKIAKALMPHVLIEFCGSWGFLPDVASYWPGAYHATSNPGGADIVSLDIYGGNIDRFLNGGKHAAWAATQSFTGLANPPPAGTWNLDTLVSFARANGVRVGMSEYGPGTAAMSAAGTGGEGSRLGANDGVWAQANIDWLNSLGSLLVYSIWSPWEPADDIEAAGTNPNDQAVWKTNWRNTYFDRSLGGWYNNPRKTPSEP